MENKRTEENFFRLEMRKKRRRRKKFNPNGVKRYYFFFLFFAHSRGSDFPFHFDWLVWFGFCSLHMKSLNVHNSQHKIYHKICLIVSTFAAGWILGRCFHFFLFVWFMWRCSVGLCAKPITGGVLDSTRNWISGWRLVTNSTNWIHCHISQDLFHGS